MKKNIILWVVLLVADNCYCQPTANQIPEFDSVQHLHNQKKLSDTAYMEFVIKHFKYQYYFVTDLANYLEYYKKVAFSNKNYYKYKSQYYKFQSNIATFKNNDGARIFYAEKIDEELKKGPDYIPTLSSLMIEMNLYANWSMPAPGIKKSNHIWPFLDSLPLLILTKKVPYSTVHNALYVCIHTQKLFYLGKDTPHADYNFVLAKKIRDAAIKRTDLYSPDNIGLFNFVIANIEYQTALFLKDAKRTEAALKEMLRQSSLAQSKKYVWGPTWVIESKMFLVKHYIEQKQTDSATKYLALARNLYDPKDASWNQNENTLLDMGAIDYLKGDYKSAYDRLKRAYRIKDSIIDLRLSDISNNMYAQTQAEFNKNELEKAQKEERDRNQIILIISTVVALGTLWLYYTMKQKERKAMKNIDRLKTASTLQIAILEEQSRLGKLEEQQKLGIELHDDLASSIAMARMSIEHEALIAKDEELRSRLQKLNTVIHDSYTRTRNKSHTLFYNSSLETEASFRERIVSLLENGLPSPTINKVVTIEEGALAFSTLDIKIEFLYIIQEAITNIIKHAKATAIDIFIYKEDGRIVLQINDNGKGFDVEKNNSGLGVQSIIKRARKINGEAEIESDKTGTMIKIVL